MSVIYCDLCDRFVDLDLDDSHVAVGNEFACNTSDDSPGADQGFYNDDPNDERA